MLIPPELSLANTRGMLLTRSAGENRGKKDKEKKTDTATTSVVEIFINVCCQMSPSVCFVVILSCKGIRTYRCWWKTIGCGNLPVDTADLFALLRMFMPHQGTGHSMAIAFKLLSKKICVLGNHSITIQNYPPLSHNRVWLASLVAVGMCTRSCWEPCACCMVLHRTICTRHYCISI